MPLEQQQQIKLFNQKEKKKERKMIIFPSQYNFLILDQFHFNNNRMKRQNVRKSKSFSSLNQTHSPAPHQFRQLARPEKTSNSTLRLRESIQNRKERSKIKDHSITDSDSSQSSCLQKKFYRCGCRSGFHDHQHRFRDYLAELRKARQDREKQESTNIYEKDIDKLGIDSFLLSETEQSEPETKMQMDEEGKMFTPKKALLDSIVEINESAEYSKRKSLNSITITLNGKKYYKTFTTKEEVLKCFTLIQSMLQ